mmetsp:Transcript_9565/g.20695  ORF Transcript_9565/g.20695 Transcript_9565/m.20695 type:complete len:272 (+) Transcript_9565:399-1214(+)
MWSGTIRSRKFGTVDLRLRIIFLGTARFGSVLLQRQISSSYIDGCGRGFVRVRVPAPVFVFAFIEGAKIVQEGHQQGRPKGASNGNPENRRRSDRRRLGLGNRNFVVHYRPGIAKAAVDIGVPHQLVHVLVDQTEFRAADVLAHGAKISVQHLVRGFGNENVADSKAGSRSRLATIALWMPGIDLEIHAATASGALADTVLRVPDQLPTLRDGRYANGPVLGDRPIHAQSVPIITIGIVSVIVDIATLAANVAGQSSALVVIPGVVVIQIL